ncbi:MAG: flagellar biosynthesis protein FlhB [Rubrobacteridae bacterium]|nr:flagellar biosynthesis protein FlhB [Rubrobacteridae bacterium]
MADKDGRTERATPKRRSETRKKGQVARSMEINSALVILAIFFALKMLGQNLFSDLKDLVVYFLSSSSTIDLTEKNVSLLFMNVSIYVLKMILPIVLIAAVAGIIASIAQTGFMMTLKPLAPKLSKISPKTGIKRMFSSKSVVDLLRSLIKIAIISYLAFSIIRDRYPEINQTINMDLYGIIITFTSIAYELGLKTGIALLILAIVDYFYQKYSFEQSIKMTKQEVKEEHKQAEGDPRVKSMIKRKQFEMSMRRMMQAVPTADVVITNPVHLAIAIKYDVSEMSAPRVIAKGQRLIAERIKELARENDVPVVEDKPLARSLFKNVEVDQEIPVDLYKAVAEVLAYVYQLNKGRLKRV